MSGDNNNYCLRLRGLPFDCTKEDIKKFFDNLEIVENGIVFVCDKSGRRTGEAYVQFSSDEMSNKAMLKNRDTIGHRYIEIFPSNIREMRNSRKSRDDDPIFDDGCVRLRGLPFDCTVDDILDFFDGLKIVPGGVTILKNHLGRATGEAYVHFSDQKIAESALRRNRQNMGHRYIEIFRSSLSEIRSVKSANNKHVTFDNIGGGAMFHIRPSPYARHIRFNRVLNGNAIPTFRRPSLNRSNIDMGPKRAFEIRGIRNEPKFKNHCVHMRGLPFNATKADIELFFLPLEPISIRMINDSSGRASGEADVEFASHEAAVRAMGKDMAHMNHRYIELFLNSGYADNRFQFDSVESKGYRAW